MLASVYYLTSALSASDSSESDANTALSSYQLSRHWSGADMISSIGSDFSYFTGADPTHGCANYGAHSELLSKQGT